MYLKTKDSLLAPASYLEATDEEIKEVVNNCGPDGFINRLVPDHLLNLDISPSCNIHDWTFIRAKNQRDHKSSDALFLKNLKAQIDSGTPNTLLKYIRYGLAYIYYGAVRVYSKIQKNRREAPKSRLSND